MATSEHDEREAGRQASGTGEPQQPERRAYSTPRVETHPLFERMALVCDPYMKNTGDDDFS